jgi:glyoxylase-like metal-dependent hydrolase (beta-lactamase superfamily II)
MLYLDDTILTYHGPDTQYDQGAGSMTIIADKKDILIERLVLGPYETNCYIVVDKKTRDSLVVDAPANAPKIIESLRGTTPGYILLTHDHSDHTGALAGLRARLKAPLAAHAADSSSLQRPPEISVKDEDILTSGNLRVKALYTPGHTPGSLCFKIGRYLFAGDTIFPGGPGKTWSPEDFKQIVASITAKILTLPAGTVILPGHGDATTVEKSKKEYAVFASRRHPDDLCGDVLWLT